MVVVVAVFFEREIDWLKSTSVCNISVLLPYVGRGKHQMTIKMPFGRKSKIRKVLTEADALVQVGKFKEAINLLQMSNRQFGSPEIEILLVNLRYRAFSHGEYSTRLEQWPPEVTDLFSETIGIPEVDSTQFNAETLRSGVFTKGSIIVRGLLSHDDIEMLRHGIEKTYLHCDLALAGSSIDATKPWYVPFQPINSDAEIPREWYRSGGAQLAADSPRGLFNLLECFEKNGIVDVITDYLGERPALSVRKTSLRQIPPNLESENGWHQDGAFLGAGIRTVNLWIALTDCGVDAPSMDMVPRRLSSIVPTGTEGAPFKWSISNQMLDEVCSDSPFSHLHFKAGDAIVFDEMNLHRTSTLPTMTLPRFAVEAWFFAPSCYPMDQLPLIV